MNIKNTHGLWYRVVPPLVLLIILGIAGFVLVSSQSHPQEEPPHELAKSTIAINNQVIHVDIARTEAERAQGLSGRDGLESDSGMLFLFEKPDRYGFWMKDMNFAIDMIWIDQDRHIVYIVPNAAPDSYPHVFAPPVPATAVLEVPANTASRLGWKPGDEVVFNGEHPSWKTFTDSARGLSFKYPEQLGTTYIHSTDWPPQVAIMNGPFECTQAGTETARAGETKKQVIGVHTYCVTKESEGAAGSMYTQYAYATEKENRILIFTFTLRFPQCGNYEEPTKSECDSERAKFDIDSIVDQIADTLVFTATPAGG